MSIEKNKEIARKCIEAINGRKDAVLYELMTPELAQTLVPGFQVAYVRAEGHYIEIIEAIAEGDIVYIKSVNSAKHTGEEYGIPASGKQWSIPAIFRFRLENDKITEFEVLGDTLDLVKQLGATITPPQN